MLVRHIMTSPVIIVSPKMPVLEAAALMKEKGIERLPVEEDGKLVVDELWHNTRSLRTKYTNAFLHGGHLYALSDGILECVSLESGERVWKGGRYGHGQMLLVDDLLLILTEAGELVLVEATPDEAAREFGRFEVLAGKTWNNLALAGDLAVVRNGEQAAVVRLPLETQ